MRTITIACLAVTVFRLAFVATHEIAWESTTYEEIAMCKSAAADKLMNASLSVTQGANEANDEPFLRDAAEAGFTEVALSKLASEKASSGKVKEFARMMVDDHTKSNDELKAISTSKGLTLPADCTDCRNQLSELQKLNGVEFDIKYMQMMTADHRRAVKSFSTESSKGLDKEVKDWAARTLPNLQNHLSAAEALKP